MKKHSLNISSKETKIMVRGKKQVEKIAIKLGNHEIA
jgi:hypothetical protein